MMLMWLQIAFAGEPQIQDHLFHVADTLRAETPASLPDAVRQRRLAYLDLLEDYAAGGVFPSNNPDRAPAARRVQPPRAFAATGEGRAPTFVDESGVHCAVGYLMGVDRPDLVARIEGTANGAYLPELQVEGVKDWAEWAGFTLDELAWIQPQYPTRVGTCPNDLTDFEWNHGVHFDEPRGCGDVTVTISPLQGSCEVCGEGHALSVSLINPGEIDAVMDLVVRTSDGTEVARERDVTLERRRRAGMLVMMPSWDQLPASVLTVSVEAEGNCAPAEEQSFDVNPVWANLEPPRCGLGQGCSSGTQPSSLAVVLLGLLGLLVRRPVQPRRP